MYIAIIVYLIINLIPFAAYGIDKYKAIHNKWRISEKALLILTAIGPFGALFGRNIFRHKTKKWYFLGTIIGFVIIHFAVFVFLESNLSVLKFY